MQVEALLQLSVAVHVREMVYVPAQAPAVVTSAKEITGAGSQLSVAVAVPRVAGVLGSSQLMVRSAGQVITGGVIS